MSIQGPHSATDDKLRAPFPMLLDGLLAAVCYLLAYRVRFSGPSFFTFLPSLLVTLPIIVASQLTALGLFHVYAPAPLRITLRRLVVATIVGSVAGATLIWKLNGLTGVSRAAFSVDLLLFVIMAAGRRTGRALWRQRARANGVPPAMVDRMMERATVGDTLASLISYRELVKNLVLRDLKLKYRGSVLGFMWSLLNPAATIGVYTIAFTFILRTSVDGFVFFLLLGVLAWTFFTNSAHMSTGAIVDSGDMIKHVAFPRAILPVATVVFNLAQYLLTVLVFLPLMLIFYRVPPAGPMLLFPVFLSLQVLFTIGIALMLAAGTAFFRDIRHLLEIALAILFWLTPIVYPLARVHEEVRMLVLLSPLSPFIVAYQEIFYYRQWPDLRLWVLALTYSLGTAAVGAWLFLSVEDQLAEQI